MYLTRTETYLTRTETYPKMTMKYPNLDTPSGDMNYAIERLLSFHNVDMELPASQLSNNGFFYNSKSKKIICFSCQIEQEATVCDITHETSCGYKQNSISFDVDENYERDATSFRTIVESNRHSPSLPTASTREPDMKTEGDRLKTFSNVLDAFAVSTKELARNGFYFIGPKDKVRCNFCKCKLSDWKENDNISQRHQNQFPDCPNFKFDHLRTPSNRPAANKQTPQLLDEAEVFPTHAQVEETDASLKIPQSIQKSPAVLAVLQEGYDKKIVEYVVKKEFKETGSAFAKASFLLEAVLKYIEEVGPVISKNHQEEMELHNASENPENDPDLEKLRKENQWLKEEKTCKICLNEDLSIVFLPCGHFVSCATCAPSLRTCPVCRSKVLGLVKAYIS